MTEDQDEEIQFDGFSEDNDVIEVDLTKTGGESEGSEDELDNKNTGGGESEEDDSDDTPTELTDDQIIQFFEKKGKKVSSLDELFQEKTQTELDAEVEAFNKYKAETGRGLEDFINAKREFESIPEDEALFRLYSEKYPSLTSEEVRDELESEFGYDEEIDTESEIKAKQRKRKLALDEARRVHESTREKYLTPLESRGESISAEDKEAIEEYRRIKEQSATQAELQQKKSQVFVEKSEAFFSDFKGFEFQTENGETYTYTPKDVNQLKSEQYDINKYLERFVDENGTLKDAGQFHRALAVAADVDGFFKYVYGIAKDAVLKEIEMESKGIPDPSRSGQQRVPKGGIVLEVEEGSGRKGYISKK